MADRGSENHMAGGPVAKPRARRPIAAAAAVPPVGTALVDLPFVEEASAGLAAASATMGTALPSPIDLAAFTEAVTSPAVHSDPLPAEPQTLPPQPEGNTEMATMMNSGEGAEKMQAMFGDVSTRFKAALEKSTKLGEEMVELTKGNVEAVVASARVAAKGGEALGQDATEYSKKSFESAVSMLKGMASIKSPTELFQLQSDYVKSAFDGAVAEASKLSESMLKIAGDVAQPLSSRYAVAAEKIKAVTA